MAAKILQLIAFLLTISTALSLTCYKCDSSQNKICAYGLGSFTYDTQDCNEGGNALTNVLPKQCVKLVAKGKDGSEYIARGCMPYLGGVCDAVAKTLGFFGSVEGSVDTMSCYPCDGDKCNSATRFAGVTLLGVVLVAVAFLF